ncbi:hypothetical protein [Pedosphaera parvula]|uniref:Uncharacterized protein n=1 Tax=Pedosphaera parvula (strain Ellin514) TaxID=320771 RepID=B9XHZ2_PEDPL|nr:hypothetical protein [Pedosphaera parvula]EEF60485.1 hypothetical protein Cflav_PD3455 [Pedosphaera parvula Ellin514]
MRNDGQNELWNDILSEVAPGEFREALLNQTLRRVRRRKQARRLGQGVMALALVIGTGLLLWQGKTNKIVKQPSLEISGVEMISSRPMAASMMVQSVPGLVELVSSKSTEMAFVDTQSPQQEFRKINDDELLALTEGKPAALIRKGPHEAELLIVDAKGQSIITAGEETLRQ